MGQGLEALRERMATIQDLSDVSSLLSWDRLTMMPRQAAHGRGVQIRTVEMLEHSMLVDNETGSLLDAAERDIAEHGGSEVDKALIRVTRYDRDRAIRVPVELVGQIAQAASDGYGAWAEARQNSDFTSFLPALERNIELRFRFVDCFEPAASPYDVLLEDFEPGLTSAGVTAIFEGLKPELRPLVQRITERADQLESSVFEQTYPVEKQRAAGRRMLELLGYDPASWRIDPTIHPFATSIGLSDIRLTTKYVEEDITDSLMSTIHEFGHGLYEARIDQSLSRTPMATGCSMTLHESQSRFWENMVGKSQSFWSLIHPLLLDVFPDQFRNTSADQLFRAVNKMDPSLIRIEADELTYGFHIILRYELERDIIHGQLKARELPEAWNAKMKEYLGVDVPSDRQGVLQDVHWSAGAIGYFPTYLLGSVLSAQIWDRMVVDLPDADQLIGSGDFAPIREWQRDHVHTYGRMYTPPETIERAVGGPLEVGPYIAYMKKKVASLYGNG